MKRREAYDLDGHATKVSRRMLDLPRMLTMAQHDGVAPRARMDWSALGGAVALAEVDELVNMLGKLEDTAYVTTTRYDAQGRVVETRLPMSGSTHRSSYTDDGLLERIDRETAAGTHERVYEAEDSDHLGRPRSVRHGEHTARTSFTYDPVTERRAPAAAAEPRWRALAAGPALQLRSSREPHPGARRSAGDRVPRQRGGHRQ